MRHTASARTNNLLEPSDQTPGHGEEHVRHVVWLADDSKPAIDHDLVASISLDEFGVLDCLPGDLRESVALDDLILLAETNGVLLAVGTVPHPVEEQVHGSEDCKSVAVPVVLRGMVVGQVEGTVTVCERNTGKVPEGEEEAQLLEVHVPEIKSAVDSRATTHLQQKMQPDMNSPAGNDQMLTLGTSVGIKPVRTSEENDFSRDVTI